MFELQMERRCQRRSLPIFLPVYQPSHAFDIEQQLAYVANLVQDDEAINALVNSVTEGVIICNEFGRMMFVNRRIEQMFGYQQVDIVGRLLNILLPDRFWTSHSRHLAKFFQTPRIGPMEKGFDIIGRRKDGTEFPIKINLSFLDTEVGRMVLAFVTDVA